MSVFRRLRKCGERKKKKRSAKYNGSLALARAGDHKRELVDKSRHWKTRPLMTLKRRYTTHYRHGAITMTSNGGLLIRQTTRPIQRQQKSNLPQRFPFYDAS